MSEIHTIDVCPPCMYLATGYETDPDARPPRYWSQASFDAGMEQFSWVAGTAESRGFSTAACGVCGTIALDERYVLDVTLDHES